MGIAAFYVVFEALVQRQLSDDEVALLQGFLANIVQPDQCLRLIEEAAGKRPCPKCGGTRCSIPQRGRCRRNGCVLR